MTTQLQDGTTFINEVVHCLTGCHLLTFVVSTNHRHYHHHRHRHHVYSLQWVTLSFGETKV